MSNNTGDYSEEEKKQIEERNKEQHVGEKKYECLARLGAGAKECENKPLYGGKRRRRRKSRSKSRKSRRKSRKTKRKRRKSRKTKKRRRRRR